jgi:hypothetical protein
VGTDREVLRRWDELEFEELLGVKTAVLDMEGLDGTAAPSVILALEYPPDFRLPAHQHVSGHVEVILEGSLKVGEHWEEAGDVRIVPARYSYGPLQSGPQGCKALEYFPDRAAIFAEMDDPAELVALLGDVDPAELQARVQRLLKTDAAVLAVES